MVSEGLEVGSGVVVGGSCAVKVKNISVSFSLSTSHMIE